MNPIQRQPAALGAILIAFGLVVWLNLWWLVMPGVLLTAGVLAYRQRRLMGRPVEAVQALLWLSGLALLSLTGLWLVGLLFLAGASLLLRGRELTVDAAIQQALQARGRRSASRTTSIQQVPITSQAPTAPTTVYEAPTTGDTTRLHQ